MLSVLIPVYNYNILNLVQDLHRQLEVSGVAFEILCLDDSSNMHYPDNDTINTLSNASYFFLEKNIGRSAIRNLLAQKANYDTLLFLDADTAITKMDFIDTYLNAITSESQIIYGGIKYQKERPPQDQLLRWVYGQQREALRVEERNKDSHLRFLTLNFIIRKNVFNHIQFNETIPNLRHEDTLFALETKRANISVIHIDNPVMHLGLESSEVFLKKSLEACESLKMFVNKKLIEPQETYLSKTAQKIDQIHLTPLVIWFYKIFRNRMRTNLLSEEPTLFIFDIYRLGYYLQLKRE